ncbi:corticotropin-releasing factor receptor 1-like [Dendronephthya gigantea]|uniref:corticotropin-releasing factor receptor 1-like n=1 Tax=Dendronephthya gigantea TaxID=151771 RepID=UPI00106D68B0|nr:corticotropin-releasing factor receptor 1-like [Dendronephthya gigantea]XP_028398746.1 corticotropin-releasing factor receptor 1-like [Dendronephthya gigantea]XP_028399497.1 corticotropin-releasing factor receptor 1-like [Dendronephthya gigantea]XP_028400255.1 corticotropin-releasing factor receptor 1-like [Dendronephthya gigantea]
MIGKYHVNLGMAVLLVLLLLMGLPKTWSKRLDWDRVTEKLKRKCFSKSNVMKDTRNCEGRLSCPRTFRESTDCWAKTCAGESANSSCPVLFFYTNVSFETFCDKNGKWNFTHLNFLKRCTKRPPDNLREIFDKLLENKDLTTRHKQMKVYLTFSWISFSFMIPSLTMLFYFIDRKNVRFNLHKNLISTFLLRVVTFFINYYGGLDTTACNVFWVFNRFFAVSEVTWMLNEALFLLKLLFRTFDAKSYFWVFFAFGWGLPAVLVFGIYVPLMLRVVDTEIDKCWETEKDSYYMFILYGPMTLMLLINFVTLIYVIYVLLDKLRISATSELLRLKKGIRAALVLMPLLGVIYLMILYVPGNPPVWYSYLIRILYPMQGTLACLVYVVFNGEVRQAIKTRWNRWFHTKSEFLERRLEVANFLNGTQFVNDQQRVNGNDITKKTVVINTDSRGFVSSHLTKDCTSYQTKACDELKMNISPTSPVLSDGGDQERPLFPVENCKR